MKIAVFFGGKSCEHNISLITGKQVLKAIDSRHEVLEVLIAQDGAFYAGRDLHNKRAKRQRVLLMPASNTIYTQKGKPMMAVDAAILATHGYGGEDGCLQGLLTLCGIPFTGCGVAASAMGMDKILMKKIFERAFLPVLPYVGFSKEEYHSDMYGVVERIKANLRFPMIVKPSSGGSSIGISVAHDFPELFESLSACFLWDNAAVVENALTSYTELNCAAIGAGRDLTLSEIEQPVSATEFLTFEDKYVQKGKHAKRVFPAAIAPELAEKVKSYTRRAFEAIGAAGVARVDFLFDGEQLYVNEINTIPGALSNYLFPKLSFGDLIERLIDIARTQKTAADSRKFVYESPYQLTSMK